MKQDVSLPATDVAGKTKHGGPDLFTLPPKIILAPALFMIL